MSESNTENSKEQTEINQSQDEKISKIVKEVIVKIGRENLTSDEAAKAFKDIIIADKSKTDDTSSKELAYDDKKQFSKLFGEYKRIITSSAIPDDDQKVELKLIVDRDIKKPQKIKISSSRKYTDPKYLTDYLQTKQQRND